MQDGLGRGGVGGWRRAWRREGEHVLRGVGEGFVTEHLDNSATPTGESSAALSSITASEKARGATGAGVLEPMSPRIVDGRRARVDRATVGLASRDVEREVERDAEIAEEREDRIACLTFFECENDTAQNDKRQTTIRYSKSGKVYRLVGNP